MINKRTFFIALIIVVLFLSLLLLNSHNITPAPHLDDLNSGALLDSLYAVALAGLVLFLAAGLGRILIKLFKLREWTFIERMVIGLPLGLAVIGYVEFFMGLLGLLKPIYHIALLIVIAIIAFTNSVAFVEEGFSCLKQFPKTWQGFSVVKKIFFSVGALALLLAFTQTLTPPWDYDGLMYHLQGPRLFLEAGRIIPIPENWFTYYPSTWEMVYMLGMGLGSDIFARLIHFTTLILLLFATYAFGKRFDPASGGWLPAAILVGIPILLVWGTFAYTDLAWALFQFLAIAFLITWFTGKESKYLVLSGVMQGLALGSKYLALSGAGIIGIFILLISLRDLKNTRSKNTAINVLIFGISTLLVAAPWYLKNFIWTGNPVFPYYLPQDTINPIELSLFMDYVGSFGTGKAWFDYILLPINIFSEFKSFGTFMGNMDIPNPVFLIVFAYPFIRNRINLTNRRSLDLLALVSIAFFVAWAAGSQQSRFLTPLYPGLAIIASSVLTSLQTRTNRVRIDQIIKIGAAGGMVIVSLLMMGKLFFLVKPYMVTTDLASKDRFLSSLVNNYPGMKYVNQQLPASSRVLMPWDGRGYYCLTGKCLPDVDQNSWTSLVKRSGNSEEVMKWLESNGVTHIFISNTDVAYFVYGHDPYNDHNVAAKYLLDELNANCANEVFANEFVRIIKVNYALCLFN